MIKDNLAGFGVDLNQIQYQVGPVLNFDPAREEFIDNAEANRMLTRAYREPFVVPNDV